MNYENLTLGIRQYDCDITEEHLDSLVKLVYDADSHALLPGNQVPILDDSKYLQPCLYDLLDDTISIELIKKSFIKCCRDYFKLTDSYGQLTRIWCYRDWKSNGQETGAYWHNHSLCYYALSGIFYLTLPKGSTTTSFSLDPLITNCKSNDHLPFHLRLDKFQRTPGPISESDIVSLPPIKHKWFIFPSILLHYPGSWKGTDEKRICIGADWWPNAEGISYNFGAPIKGVPLNK